MTPTSAWSGFRHPPNMLPQPTGCGTAGQHSTLHMPRSLLYSTAALLLSLLATGAKSQSPSVPAHDTMAARMQACTACHGKEGRAAADGYYPRLAGKPAGYLYNQLLNFREGRRHYPLMTQLLDPLSDDYLREIAEYFAAQDAPYPAPPAATAPLSTLQRGEALVRQGDASRQLPACVQCHGQSLAGVAPSLPGLLGLPRDYLIGQLGAWRTGQRHAHAPDCMAQISKQLTPADVSAVAHWLAAQPVPADYKPELQLSAALPIPCGGVTP